MKPPIHHLTILVVLAFILMSQGKVQGNVYATDIQINGSFSPAILLPGNTVTITYVLNDNATGGVSVQIQSGTNVVKTFSSTNGTAGANAGLNSLTWDGTTDSSNTVAEGPYSVVITAAATGYRCWTNITDDGPNFHAEVPRGIAVNQDTHSPYYGRVYIANAPYPQGEANPGIIKRNADGSPADEGGFSTGGISWDGGGFSPWKICVGPDDRLYVDDFANAGVVYSFDATICDTNVLHVLDTGNYPPGDSNVALSGLTIVGPVTNMEIWMTDENPYGSAGIIGWSLSAGVTASGDPGTVIVPTNDDGLSQAPYDISVDTNGFIYTIQQLTNSEPAYALLSFAPYDGTLDTNVDWAVSMFPRLEYASGLAVDPTAECLAVAVVGTSGGVEYNTKGGFYLFNAETGDLTRNLDRSGGDAYFDAAWDKVGNLYALDASAEVWRAYSPPGPNQATTVAVPFVQYYNAILPPSLNAPAANGGEVNFTLVGQGYVTYIIQKSCDLSRSNWWNVATNYSASADRNISLPVCGSHDFYRALAVP